MTEAEWLVCEEPELMLACLGEKASSRKLRLLVCGCCRAIWSPLHHELDRKAVEVAERFADGEADKDELETAREAAVTKEEGVSGFGVLAWSAASPDAAWAVVEEASAALTFAEEAGTTRAQQASLLREIVRPHSLSDALEPSCQSLEVVRLARTCYDERDLPSGYLDNARLAVLSDALEEGGCTDADLLCHLRSAGPHVRGCWALDLILGRQ